MFSSAVASTAPNNLVPPVSSADNVLENPLWAHGSFYPVGFNYNGVNRLVNATTSTATGNGVNASAPAWRHYSPLIIATDQYYTYMGNLQILDNPGYTVTDFSEGAGIPNPLIIYGSATLFTGSAAGDFSNNNADRGASQNGKHTNLKNTRMVTHTTLSTIDSSTAMTNVGLWSHVTEWFQTLTIPDGKTTAKFGAKVRIPAADKLRELNFAGFYVWSENATGLDKKVHYIRIKHTDASYTLPTGDLTGDPGKYNWTGMSNTPAGTVTDAPSYTNQTTTTATESLLIDQDNIEQWTDIEATITLETGTSRKLGFAMYYAENCSYMHEGDDDLHDPVNAAVTSGGLQVFAPYVTFHD